MRRGNWWRNYQCAGLRIELSWFGPRVIKFDLGQDTEGTPFSSPEAALLLVSTKNRDLWPSPTPEVRDSRTSRHSAQVQSDKSDWFWSQSIVFTKPFKNGMPLDQARGRDSWCCPKGARPLGTIPSRERVSWKARSHLILRKPEESLARWVTFTMHTSPWFYITKTCYG